MNWLAKRTDDDEFFQAGTAIFEWKPSGVHEKKKETNVRQNSLILPQMILPFFIHVK